MDLKSLAGGNLNISEQLNERIPIKEWNLLQPTQQFFNFGKKGRKIYEKNDRILDWKHPSKSQLPRKENQNQQMKRRYKDITIPRPIKYRKHLLPFQRTPPVRFNVSCFNLPKSFFNSAMLGITPQKIINDNEKTISSNFIPQITSTPLTFEDLFKNSTTFSNTKASSFQSYTKFLSSVQFPINKSVKELFPNDITENIIFRLRASHRSPISAPQSIKELIRTEAADVLSQKRAKISFLRKGWNKNLQNSYTTFTMENDEESTFLKHGYTIPRKEPTSPDFTLSPFWLQESLGTPDSSSNFPLAINNQLNEDWRQNLNINEVLPNLTKPFKSTPFYKDQHFNLEWQNAAFSSLVREKSNCEEFGANNPILQNPDCEIFKSTSFILPQNDFKRLVHENVTSQLILTEDKSMKENMKRRTESQLILNETNQSWKRSLLDESLQTNSSEIIRSIDHLIKQSPNVKPNKFNIYEKSKWD